MPGAIIPTPKLAWSGAIAIGIGDGMGVGEGMGTGVGDGIGVGEGIGDPGAAITWTRYCD